jgi:hypothetical protein
LENEDLSLEEEIVNNLAGQLSPDTIPIYMDAEELHVIVRSLGCYIAEYEGIDVEVRNVKLAQEMVKVFVPALVERKHPHYVSMDNGESNE